MHHLRQLSERRRFAELLAKSRIDAIDPMPVAFRSCRAAAEYKGRQFHSEALSGQPGYRVGHAQLLTKLQRKFETIWVVEQYPEIGSNSVAAETLFELRQDFQV